MPSTFPATALACLGSCTQLTSLILLQAGPWEGAAIQELAKQLPRLTVLQHLRLHHTLGRTTDAASEANWQACVLAMVKLPALRRLELENCGLGAAAAKLCGATQLTRLRLSGCGVGVGDKAALCAAMKHLGKYRVHLGKYRVFSR